MKTDELAEPAEFRITSSYQAFADRQKNLFDQLDIVEHSTRSLLSSSDALMDVDSAPEGIARSMRQFRGKESIFKKPLARPPRSMPNRRLPDYHRNPHKWTRYSLDDVRSEDMSERSNTAAAMSFLKELESRKDAKPDLGVQKIAFKRVGRRSEKEVGGAAPMVFRNSKLIMPEYVVGQQMKKEQKRRERIGGSDGGTKEIKLDHLEVEEEDTE